MEILFSIVIILGLLLLAGVDLGGILAIVLGLIGVLVVLIGLFFTACLALVAMSRRKRAAFLEMDDSGRYPAAVYDVGGDRVKNFFPCEMVMRSRLYVPAKEIHILHCAPIKRTIDGNALVTIIVGALIFIPASVLAVMVFVSVFSNGLAI